MIRLFTGWDEREALGSAVFDHSVSAHSTVPVSITRLHGKQRDGSNAFTYARFLVPQLCAYSANTEGFAIFADGADMLAMADLAELWALRDGRYAVQVVKHEYKTKHPRKYIGTDMECDNRDYPRKNWSSLIIFNCMHVANAFLNEANVRESSGADLHRFYWLRDDQIGELPPEWNWLCQEHGVNHRAKLVHYTAGIPQIPAYTESPHAGDWFAAAHKMYAAPAAVEAPRWKYA